MWFFNLIGGIKGVLILVILIALSGYIWKLKHDTSVVQTQLEKVTQERNSAGLARDAAISANKTNQAVIAELKNERDLVQSSLDNLKRDNLFISTRTSKIKEAIKSQATLPENNTLLSPVVKDTINQIQLNRIKP